MHYINRNALESAHYLLSQFPCVAVLGPRQAGKTTFLRYLLPNARFFDLEKDSEFYLINRDPEFFLQDNPAPLILDEAQLCPKLFSALRVRIDANRSQAGQYLISGSSSPELLSNISESLAGRIAIIELEPFTLNESWEKPSSPFYKMLAEAQFSDLKSLKPRYEDTEIYLSCVYGGYPEPFIKKGDLKFHSQWMENYFRTYIDRDIRMLFPGLNINSYKRFIRMLAFASGNILNLSDFARSLDVSQPTVKHYFEIVEGTFLWRSLPSYQKSRIKRVIKAPKGFLRDTGLINHLLQIESPEKLKMHPQFGRIWEVFIQEQLIRNLKAQLTRFDYSYYRTQSQDEIDLILEGSFGIIPIEIKSGIATDLGRLRSLQRFAKENGSPIAIVINRASEVTYLAPGVIQIPAAVL